MGSTETEHRRRDAWQRALLPFMMWTVALLTAFFFVASIIQLYDLQNRITAGPTLDLQQLFDDRQLVAAREGGPGTLELARWKILTTLEKGAVERRYHQANVLLMSRVWIHYLGFVTGMILALVGAVFILGRLSESRSQVSASTALWKVAVSTSSPGLVMAVLGTALMLTTLMIRHEIRVDDEPLYTTSIAPVLAKEPPKPPAPWPAEVAPPAPKPAVRKPSEPDKEAELMKKRALEILEEKKKQEKPGKQDR